MMIQNKREDISLNTLRKKQKADPLMLAFTITLFATLATATTAVIIPAAFATPAPPPTCNADPNVPREEIATIVGTSGDDNIVGTPNRDVIAGLGGNDRIIGLGGDDLICGGDGNDVILGGDGDDFILGGDGNDVILGEAGNDFTIFGGDGNDLLLGGADNDFLDGQTGTDRGDGGPGFDACINVESVTNCED
jgi:Ca2+-binding RTX toxin-like protein